MQKNFTLLLLLTCCFISIRAQVGVGTTTPNSTLDVRGSFSTAYRAFNGATTAASSDNLLVFTGSAPATLTLPDATSCSGRMYWVKTSSTSVLTIAASSGQNIDGAATWTLADKKTVKLVSTGTNWLVTAESAPGAAAPVAALAWIPGGNNLASAQTLGTTTNTDLPFITNNTEKMRLTTTGRLELGTATGGDSTAFLLRAAIAVNKFDPTLYSNYNGSVLQTTYPGSLTGQDFNIAATGSNSGNWSSNISFWTRNNGGTNATEKMRLTSNGRLEVGSNSSPTGPAILTRSSTTTSSFNAVNYADYNGGVIQSTYPGGLIGQDLNIAAVGANAGNWPSNIAFWTRNNGGANATEKMRLMNNGRLEVGTNLTPTGPAILTRSATATSNFNPASYADYNGGVIQSTYPGGFIGQNLNIAATGSNSGNWPSNIVFWTRANGGTNSVERMRISDDGNIGIGCIDPKYKLQVVGDIAASGGVLRAASAVISTTITACSDFRYKKDITPLRNTLANVMKLQGVAYNWKVAEFPDKYFTDKHQVGIIAQDLEKIYPELVETDANGYKTVDYSKMAPVLIEAIKEQQGQISAQQKEINALKKDLEEIKKAIAGAKK